ncbi:glycoside hydrolase [Vararia minispora EC-137]|uniref:Glycoside hydrolase n=1 Tax=Vararia minispora EC-137 TaxID=1314806 RepID=A0ACB8QZW6_9AGAM|nr:glycoside hydrolase [Vararia minispora EC-137]
MTPTSLALACAIALTVTAAEGASVATGTQQTVRGIGASGAWWVNDLAHFPDSVRQNVSELLFNPTTGLGLTDWRYNLGGGGVGVTNPSRVAETPYISDGVYDFSADAAGIYYLKEAVRHGVPIITLFVNSAPTAFTSNGQNCGGSLNIGRLPAYAQYIADVVSYWKTQGIVFTHVSPMNEPDNSFSGCGQEGMSVNILQRGQVLQAVASALSNAGLTTKVIGDETSWALQFAVEAPLWLDSHVGTLLDGVAHHQYNFLPGPLQAVMTAEARSLSGGKLTWSTEICCFKELLDSDANDPLSLVDFGAKYDPTMVGGLRMALLIHQALADAEDEHWDWWTALSSSLGSCTPASNASCVGDVNYNGWEDGLIYYDPNFATDSNFNIYLTKRYQVLKHYSRAVPYGAILRNVSTSILGSESRWRVVMFDYPQAGTPYALVAMNAQAAEGSITITGVDGFTIPSPKIAFRTSVDEDYAQISTPATASDGSLSISAPAMSIYTLFF